MNSVKIEHEMMQSIARHRKRYGVFFFGSKTEDGRVNNETQIDTIKHGAGRSDGFPGSDPLGSEY